MKEQEPKTMFDERQWKLKWRRVGLELDDEQLSQVPRPEPVEEEPLAKPVKPKLGSFWTDEY